MTCVHGSPQAKQDTTELESRGKALKEGIGAAEKRLAEVEIARDAALAQIGNLVHDSVPVDDDEVRRQSAKILLGACRRELRRARALSARVAGNMHPAVLHAWHRLGAGMPSHLNLPLHALPGASLLTTSSPCTVSCL